MISGIDWEGDFSKSGSFGVDSFRLWYVVVDVEEERFSGRDVGRITTQANTQSTKRIWYKEYI